MKPFFRFNFVAFWALAIVQLIVDSQLVAADYVGAVAEHTAYLGLGTDTPKFLLDVNIELYENLTAIASINNAQVLVFPEFGLTPISEANERSDLYPFAEEIPDIPTNESQLISPCITPSSFVNSPILLRMSCSARKNKIIVLINMIDWVDCSVVDDSNCPSDGHYQYNTDVLFDEEGYMVAKYHKSHEWPGLKKAYDQPSNPSLITYTSKFGVQFGLFICFDIMFPDPPKVLRAMGVEHFLYAVKQGNVGEHLLIEPWSKHNAATILSANLGSGSKDCSGIVVNGTALDATKIYNEKSYEFKEENILVAIVPS